MDSRTVTSYFEEKKTKHVHTSKRHGNIQWEGQTYWRQGECLNIFDCLFVCLLVVIKPYFASYVGREINPLGVISHRQWHKPRAYQRQRHKPRTCQSIVNTKDLEVPIVANSQSL